MIRHEQPTYTLVERCCGSAALTFHLLGARRPIVPYQGGKWRYRRELTALLAELGFHGPPSRVVLTDPGPWGRVVRVLLDLPRGSREETRKILTRWSELEPRGVYDCLQGAETAPEDDPTIDGPAAFAAEFLYLQRLAFSGKAVGIRNGRWSSPGFNKTSAYGTPGVPGRFGEIKPLPRALALRLGEYASWLPRLDADAVLTACTDARSNLDRDAESPHVEYIDPPYQSATKYPGGHLDRSEVVALALAAQARGSAVIVSEAGPIAELVDRGWRTRCLREGTASGASPFKSRGAEWVTYTSGAT